MNEQDLEVLKALLNIVINRLIETLALKTVLLVHDRIPETELQDALELAQRKFAPLLKQLAEVRSESLPAFSSRSRGI